MNQIYHVILKQGTTNQIRLYQTKWGIEMQNKVQGTKIYHEEIKHILKSSQTYQSYYEIPK